MSRIPSLNVGGYKVAGRTIRPAAPGTRKPIRVEDWPYSTPVPLANRLAKNLANENLSGMTYDATNGYGYVVVNRDPKRGLWYKAEADLLDNTVDWSLSVAGGSGIDLEGVTVIESEDRLLLLGEAGPTIYKIARGAATAEATWNFREVLEAASGQPYSTTYGCEGISLKPNSTESVWVTQQLDKKLYTVHIPSGAAASIGSIKEPLLQGAGDPAGMFWHSSTGSWWVLHGDIQGTQMLLKLDPTFLILRAWYTPYRNQEGICFYNNDLLICIDGGEIYRFPSFPGTS